MMCGGLTEQREGSKEVQKICDVVKKEVESKCGKTFPNTFEVVHYKTQVVAGTNYFVKIKVSEDGDHIHARIFQSLPHAGSELKVRSVETNKKLEDVLDYF